MSVQNLKTGPAIADLGSTEGSFASEGQGPAENPILHVHALLRGRYHWAVLLGLFFAVGGTVAGFKLTVPVYQSTGLVRIKPTLPRIVGPGEAIMPMYEAFIESQVSLVEGERVINLALQDPDWKAAGGRVTPEAFAAFSKNLEVKHPQGGELLVITFTDKDPATAMAAVHAVTKAYEQVYKERDFDGQKRDILDGMKRKLTADLAAKDNSILRIAPYGTSALQEMYAQRSRETAEIASKLREVEVEIAEVDTTGNGSAATQPAAAAAATQPATATIQPAATQPAQQELSPEEIASTDARMAEELRQLSAAESELERMRRRWLGNHPNVTDAEAAVVRARQDVERYAKLVNRSLTTAHQRAAARGDFHPAEDLQSLTRRKQNLADLLTKSRNDLKPLAEDVSRVNKESAESEQIRKDLDETKAALQAMDNESAVGGRLEVLSTGDRPIAPTKDRRVAAAAGGGLGGLAAGFGVLLLFGLLDRRLKDTADAQLAVRRTSRLLGILPHLPEDLSDPEQSAMAAHCVHHIRGRLQIDHDAVGHRALAITSPSASDGKTTLVLALGLSFAASRSKTLLIDFDVVGGGLTARTNTIIRRRIGQVLLQQGLVEPAQLERALKVARESGAQLGDVLVKLGYVLPEELEAGLTVQQERTLGLLDALAGEPLEDCIAATGVPNLSVLPLGEAGPRDVAVLAPSAINGIISEARAKFDTILIDTGPILGSLEASLVASQVDRVALVVSRGQRRPLVDRAIEVLTGAGANVAGIVFNRAGMNDLLTMSSGSGSGGEYRPSRPPLLESSVPSRSGGPFGPLASAVISSTSKTTVKAHVRAVPAADIRPQ